MPRIAAPVHVPDDEARYMNADGAPTAKGQRTRARILASARRELEQHGYFDASVTGITAGSGVALGTFYRYFQNKEDAFMVLLEQLVDELYHTSGGSWNAADPRASIESATRNYLLAYQTNGGLISALIQMAAAVPECAAKWAQLRDRTHARMARRLPEDLSGVEPRLAVSALAMMVEQYAFRWYVEAPRAGQRSPAIDQSVAALSHIWFRAIYLDGASG